jgi:hypothetical protein
MTDHIPAYLVQDSFLDLYLQGKMNPCRGGRVIPLDCLYVVRLWSRNQELACSELFSYILNYTSGIGYSK